MARCGEEAQRIAGDAGASLWAPRRAGLAALTPLDVVSPRLRVVALQSRPGGAHSSHVLLGRDTSILFHYIDGVVITLLDITDSKGLSSPLRQESSNEQSSPQE